MSPGKKRPVGRGRGQGGTRLPNHAARTSAPAPSFLENHRETHGQGTGLSEATKQVRFPRPPHGQSPWQSVTAGSSLPAHWHRQATPCTAHTSARAPGPDLAEQAGAGATPEAGKPAVQWE